jgi:peptide/nickel transport system substrate-binding protein
MKRRDVTETRTVTLTRRDVLKQAAALGLMVPGIAGVVAACTPQTSSPTPTSAGPKQTTFTVGLNVDPPTLNPMLTTTAADESVILSIVEKLGVYDATTMETKTWLLDSWSYKDSSTVQLNLKKGIKFSNGEALDASAAKFSFEAWMAEPISRQTAASLVGATFQVVDEQTLVIAATRPLPTFASIIGRYTYMVPPKYYAQVGAQGFGKAPIGTGPFLFGRRDPGQQIVLDVNPNYWQGARPIKQLVYRVMIEDLSRATAVETGEIDLAYYIPYNLAQRLRTIQGVKVWAVPGQRKHFALFNIEMPGGEPLQDPRVRVAINMAVDVDAIVKGVFQGEGVKLGGSFALPTEFGYSKDIPAYRFSPTEAKKMIADAGYPNGFPITLAYTVGRYPYDKEAGQIVATYLEQIGLKVEQKALEFGEFSRQRTAKTLGHLIMFGILIDPDLDATYNYVALGKAARGAPLMTFPKDWLDLYNKATVTVDREARGAIYKQLLQMDYASPYALYLYATNDFYATRETVQGFTPRRDQFLFLQDVNFG